MATNPYGPEELQKRTEEILRFATSQPLLDELQEVLKAPLDKQFEEAAKRFAPERLSGLGLTVPPDTRFSSRIFDEPSGRAIVLGPGPTDSTLSLALPPEGLTEPTLDKLVDRKAMLERALEHGWSVCICVGAGGCVGIGGGS